MRTFSLPHNVAGFSSYRGTLVLWDEDHDERVLHVLDRLPRDVRRELIAVAEHEGALTCFWRADPVQGPYNDGGLIEVLAADGSTEDYWLICTGDAILARIGS